MTRWIPTKINPADGLSRGKEFTENDWSHTTHLMRSIGMEWEEGTMTKEINKQTKVIPVDTVANILMSVLSKDKISNQDSFPTMRHVTS